MSQIHIAVAPTLVVAAILFLLSLCFVYASLAAHRKKPSTEVHGSLNRREKRTKEEEEVSITPTVLLTLPPAIKAKDSSSYERTYRVQGIPAACTQISTKRLLQSVLGFEDESSGVEVHSLAFSPYKPRDRASKVATFTFKGDSKYLPSTEERLTFPIPEDGQSNNNVSSRKPKISIDSHFEGFTPLNLLETDEEYKVDCIAISGLGSHAYGSFKERGGHHMWLRDSLPHDIQGLRVLIYGYESRVPNSKSSQNLEAISSSFRTALRANENAPRPLIFLAHSLGGLVLKKALVQMKSSDNPLDKANFRSTYAALFFGVPNQGMDISSLVPMAEGQDNLPFLMNLGKESELLRDLHVDFSLKFDFKDSIIMSYYETERSPTAKQDSNGRWTMSGESAVLVTMSSATHGRPWENLAHYIQAINRNHSELVKFSYHDEIYNKILDQMKDLTRDAVKVVQIRSSNATELSQDQIKCLKDVNRPPFSEIRNEKVREPERGTLEWFFERQDFKSWRDEDESSKLLIRGSPGQGKSVLAKSVLNHLDRYVQPMPNHDHFKVIYFFCYNQEKDFRTTSSIIRAFIVQLLVSPSLFEHLPQTYQANPEEFKSAQFGTLWSIFCGLICDPYYDTIYCVIDALDECESSTADLLSRLLELFSRSILDRRPRLKIFVTSRPVRDIANELERFPCIDLKAATEDLKIFVRSKVQSLPENFSLELRKRASELLLEGAEQTFLWVSIVVKKFERMTFPSVAKLEATIRESSTDLATLYSDIIRQIMEGPEDEQKLVAWVVYGRRPLSLRELEAALATQMNSKNKRSTDHYRTDLTAKAVASAAGVILEITDNIVRLIHQSAKDFILQEKQLTGAFFADGLGLDIYLAKVCMTYLGFDDFKAGLCGSIQKLAQRKSEYPLFDYAARKWHTHIQGKSDIEQVSNLLLPLIEPRSLTLLSWGEAAGIKNLDTANSTLDIAMKANIMWLAEYNLNNTKITEEQVRAAAENLGRGYEVMDFLLRQANTIITGEAVQAIVSRFNEKIVKLMLDNNPDIEVTGAMTLAAAGNPRSGNDVMRLLLDKFDGIEITEELVEVAAGNTVSGKEVVGLLLSRDNIKITERAVTRIAEMFDTELIGLLLDGRGDIRITKELVNAVAENEHGGKEMMELLLSRGDIEVTEGAVATIAHNFDAEVVGLLLDRAGEVKITDVVVEAAAENIASGKEVVGLLLSRDNIEITERAVTIIAERFGTDVIELLSDGRGDIRITKELTNALADSKHDGKEMIELLLSRDDIEVTEDAVAAMAHNFDAEVMALLLDRAREIKITEEVVEAAAGNDGNGKKIMELLLSRGDIQITEMVMEKLSSERQLCELFMIAASQGHEAVVRLLLEEGANVETKGSKGWTALHWAAYYGYEGVVRLLLDSKADIKATDTNTWTALKWAIKEGQKAVAELLLERGADIEAYGADGRTALHWGAYYNQELAVQLLLEKGAKIEARDTNEWTALYCAAMEGHQEVLQLLLEKGADIKAKDANGRTALHWAAYNEREVAVQLLLEKGADIEAKDINGWTVLYRAAREGHKAVVQLLLENGADVEAKDVDGWTAIHWAAYNGYKNVVQLLLENKTNIELKDANGWTALYCAANEGHKATVQLLLEKGANIEAKGDKGWTVLHMAAYNQQKEVVQLLLENGANVEAKDANEWTALHWAADNKQNAILQLLLEKGADINTKDTNGWTALHWAACNGYKVITKLLLENGADIETKDTDGWTALYCAAREGHEPVARLLLERGADSEAKDANGWTALYCAAKKGHDAIVQLLLEKVVNAKAGYAKREIIPPDRPNQMPSPDYDMFIDHESSTGDESWDGDDWVGIDRSESGSRPISPSYPGSRPRPPRKGIHRHPMPNPPSNVDLSEDPDSSSNSSTSNDDGWGEYSDEIEMSPSASRPRYRRPDRGAITVNREPVRRHATTKITISRPSRVHRHSVPAPLPPSSVDPEDDYPGYGRGFLPPNGPYGARPAPPGYVSSHVSNPPNPFPPNTFPPIPFQSNPNQATSYTGSTAYSYPQNPFAPNIGGLGYFASHPPAPYGVPGYGGHEAIPYGQAPGYGYGVYGMPPQVPQSHPFGYYAPPSRRPTPAPNPSTASPATTAAENVKAAEGRIELEKAMEPEKTETEKVEGWKTEGEKIEAEKIEAEKTEPEKTEIEKPEPKIEGEKAESGNMEPEKTELMTHAMNIGGEKTEDEKIEIEKE